LAAILQPEIGIPCSATSKHTLNAAGGRQFLVVKMAANAEALAEALVPKCIAITFNLLFESKEPITISTPKVGKGRKSLTNPRFGWKSSEFYNPTIDAAVFLFSPFQSSNVELK
jgi:hypothetical protein